MTFSISPSVDVLERDLTLFTKAIVSYSGAIAGAFQWGPVEERVYITNGEEELVQKFGKPDADTYQYFMAASSFLAYKLPLYVVRVVGASALNAVPSLQTAQLIKNRDEYDAGTFTGISVLARYPGTMGNGLRVETCPQSEFDGWAYENQFDFAPGADEFHFVIVDVNGNFGTAGAVLERFSHLQTTAGAVKSNGENAYYFDVLNNQSAYVYAGDSSVPPTGASVVTQEDLSAGADDNTTVTLTDGYDLFSNPDDVEIAFLIGGPAGASDAGSIMDIAATRKDCFAFISPEEDDVVNNSATVLTDVLEFRNTGTNKNTSYAVMDCNWKYMYDRYNNVNRWVPCNGDTAGLLGRVYLNQEPWESPAGYSSGQLLNVIKLAWSPTKAQRDELYKAQINPIISAKGSGHVLLGDKTQLNAPSAFGYINVRSLFIILEKSIADSAKAQLFKINNTSTRSQFRNQTTQFLRNIQSRGGVEKFLVIADESNNTEQVISNGQFVGSIVIKPPRTINNIILEFNAVSFDVQFEEIENKTV